MAETNTRISRRILEEVYGQGRMGVIDEIVATDAVGHDAATPAPIQGRDGLRDAAAGYRAAFPDLHVTVEAQIAEGDVVATRWTATGTHQGDFFGAPPTEKHATTFGITIDRIVGGLIVESWTNWDTLGLLTQLGVIPTPALA